MTVTAKIFIDAEGAVNSHDNTAYWHKKLPLDAAVQTVDKAHPARLLKGCAFHLKSFEIFLL